MLGNITENLANTTIIISGVMLWKIFKWSGLILLILSILALFKGSLPDNDSSPVWDFLRWIFGILIIIWLVVIIIAGLNT